MKVKKCIIPIAGRGTRRLPVTKTVSKEMLPILNEPTIMLLVKECLESDIEEIIFVVNKDNHNMIKDFFTKNNELEEFINNSSKKNLLNDLNKIIDNIKFHYVIQDENIRGTSGAIYAAKEYINDEYFGVIFGDDLVDSDTPYLKELINECEKYNSNVIGVREVDEIHKNYYYVIKYKENNIMESFAKTKEEKEIASNHMMLGRLVLNSTIFDRLLETIPHDDNEYFLPDALEILDEEIRCVICNGEYYNIGNIAGFIKANLAYGLKNDKIKVDIENFVKEKISK